MGVIIKKVKKLKPIQLKGLSEFANKIAAAWFTAGIISPFFTKPESLFAVLRFLLVGLLMTGATLLWSLSLLDGVKS